MIKASPATPIARMDSHEQSTRDFMDNDEYQLDLEVNRFLEADFALHQFDRNPTGADLLSDEMHFMDIRSSIDMPDLDFGDSHQATTTTEVSQPSPSLRVVIPASALLPPPPASKARPKRKAEKQTWSAIWSKRQKAVKNELLSLYQQVNTLESKLDGLREKSGDSENLQRILKHEIDEKQKSEAENVKLKRMLKNQLETSRRVAEILRKCEDHAEE